MHARTENLCVQTGFTQTARFLIGRFLTGSFAVWKPIDFCCNHLALTVNPPLDGQGSCRSYASNANSPIHNAVSLLDCIPPRRSLPGRSGFRSHHNGTDSKEYGAPEKQCPSRYSQIRWLVLPWPRLWYPCAPLYAGALWFKLTVQLNGSAYV